MQAWYMEKHKEKNATGPLLLEGRDEQYCFNNFDLKKVALFFLLHKSTHH